MKAPPHNPTAPAPTVWEKHVMARDDVTARLERITKALTDAGVPFALIGGQAVALWVATKDPAAVRTTKDVDLLLSRADLPRARAAARTADMDYFEVVDVGMFLDRADPNPRHGVHLLWAEERVRPGDALPVPAVDEHELFAPTTPVVTLAGLVRMKLMANRDRDRVHLRDMIDVGLIERELRQDLPPELAERLDALLTEAGL